MTKNNLAVHLKWLLKQGPSLYPSLTSAGDNQIVHVDSDIASDRNHRQWDVSGTDFAGPHATTATTIRNPEANDAVVSDDDDMARLALAPHSASKPRMLSLANNASRTPKASDGWRVGESPTRDRGTQRNNGVEGMVAS